MAPPLCLQRHCPILLSPRQSDCPASPKFPLRIFLQYGSFTQSPVDLSLSVFIKWEGQKLQITSCRILRFKYNLFVVWCTKYGAADRDTEYGTSDISIRT